MQERPDATTARALQALTDDQLNRAWNAAYDRMNRGYGYDPYGWDWPTLRIVKPTWARTLGLLRDEFRRRRALQRSA